MECCRDSITSPFVGCHLLVADEMDAEAVAREAAGEAAIASAFARAMAADDAHNDRRLVAVANAVALSECAPLQAAFCFPSHAYAWYPAG